MEEIFFSTKEAANWLRERGCKFSEGTLAAWRHRGKTELKWHKVMSRIFYKKSDLENFIKGKQNA
jgi:hypothetical protein